MRQKPSERIIEIGDLIKAERPDESAGAIWGEAITQYLDEQWDEWISSMSTDGSSVTPGDSREEDDLEARRAAKVTAKEERTSETHGGNGV